MKRKLLIMLLCLSIAANGIGLIYGMVSVDVVNEFETGIVDISLQEFQIEDGKEVPWVDNPLLLPGDTVSKIPRIYNNGVDCYIRAKFAIKDMPDLDADNIFGISDKWLLADDGYYYYTQILKAGENADLFYGLKIPVDFPQTNEGKSFQIEVDVDAIQSKNFTPNYENADPWGSVMILKNEKTDEYDINTLKQSDSKNFQIVYQGSSGKLIKNQDDFFSNFPYIMPGDSFSDSAIIENNSSNPIVLHFRSEANDKSALLDKITLKITSVIGDETKIVYQGTLRAEDLSKDTIIGTIPANTKAEFIYEISVPTSINNEYTLSDSEVVWIFSTEETTEEIPEKNPEKDPEETPDKTPEETTDVKTPHTGDDFNMTYYVLLMAGSTLACVVLLLALKKEKKEATDHA